MTASFRLFLLLALALAPWSSPSVGAEPQKTILWKATGLPGTVYLLGSLHLARPELYPLDPRIENAFEKSDALAVEANVANIDPSTMTSMLSAMMYPADTSLEKELSEETAALLATHLESLGVPGNAFNRYRPWFVSQLVLVSELQKMGILPEHGIDLHFLKLAEGKKPILELESLEEQLALLSGFEPKLQDLFLRYSLLELQVAKKAVDEMLTAWAEGDLEALEVLMKQNIESNEELQPIQEKLFTERNRTMAETVTGYLGEDRTTFVVVGAGHLIGEGSVVALLREKGFEVERQ